MQKECYLISEAAELVQVESHVLRYWEEELDLNVPRNEMGHRYYTIDNMEQFFKIKELKEQGYQLKEIRLMLKEKDKPEADGLEKKSELVTAKEQAAGMEDTDSERQWKLEQFQNMMSEIVKQALAENTTSIGREMGQEMSDRVIKEMNYIMRVQDEQEEERFRKLDEAIRQSFRRKRKKEEKKSRYEKKENALKPKFTT